MKTLKVFRPFLILMIALAVAQFACSAGTQAPTSNVPQNNSQPSPSDSQAAPTTSATKSERGTPTEAQAMLKLAVAHYQSVGRDQALKDFTGRVSPFFDRDLYVACIDSRLVQSANGGFPNLVGSSVEPLSRARWDAASTDKIDSISYSYIDPAAGMPAPKTFFYEKVGSDVCGVGAYNP